MISQFLKALRLKASSKIVDLNLRFYGPCYNTNSLTAYVLLLKFFRVPRLLTSIVKQKRVVTVRW